MKLSEAIRLGAMMKPQAFDSKYGDDTCALNAAKDAIGFPRGWEQLHLEFPILTVKASCHMPTVCHVSQMIRTVGDMCWHLNDQHRWTRERIADWVETIENQQVETVAAPVEDYATTHD